MNSTVSDLTAKMARRPPASRDALLKASHEFGVSFPADYVAFMVESNGATGRVGARGYLDLWSVEYLTECNREESQSPTTLSGLIVFGSDGGGELYALAGQPGEEAAIVEVPAVGERSDAVPCGTTLLDLLQYLGGGEPFTSDDLAYGKAASDRLVRDLSQDSEG